MTTHEMLEYQALRRLAEGSVANQRSLTASLGASRGKANYVIRALLARGRVTVENVSRNPNRSGYVYLLNPKGLTEKARLTRRYLKRNESGYEELQREIDILAREVRLSDLRTLAS